MNAYTEGNKLIKQRMELSAQTDKLGEIQKVSERYQRHSEAGKPTASAKRQSPSGSKINCEKTR